MNAELRPLLDFILKHTHFSFKEYSTEEISVWANFQYEGIKSSVEGFRVKRLDAIGNQIDVVVIMLISEATQKAFKIYQRNQILETILN
jgi:hypothetical protein